MVLVGDDGVLAVVDMAGDKDREWTETAGDIGGLVRVGVIELLEDAVWLFSEDVDCDFVTISSFTVVFDAFVLNVSVSKIKFKEF